MRQVGKPPMLTLATDKQASVHVWRSKFDTFCIMQDWRDTDKPNTDNAHWNHDKAVKEISAFYLALPDDVLTTFELSCLK